MKPTQAQSSLGREGAAPETCRSRIFSCRPSSPFSLSMRPLHAKEPTNDETPPQDIASKSKEARVDDLPMLELLLTFCGGGAIKALYATANNGGGSKK